MACHARGLRPYRRKKIPKHSIIMIMTCRHTPSSIAGNQVTQPNMWRAYISCNNATGDIMSPTTVATPTAMSRSPTSSSQQAALLVAVASTASLASFRSPSQLSSGRGHASDNS
ncbi:hypothetical protein LZ32DRAFT_238065 [Colletotrichum eremochloae]|nr:hypothetical protein LZ32DRAFT_238065 [Colletotrichum eremochloae]